MASGGTGGAGPKPPKPDIANQLIMLVAFMAAIFVLFDKGLRQSLGEIVGIGLKPLVGFGGELPLFTLVLTGTLMTFFSVTVRHFFVNWIEQARNQRISSAFSKEMREARSSRCMLHGFPSYHMLAMPTWALSMSASLRPVA